MPDAFVVDQDGEVIGTGPADLRKLVADLPYDLAPGRHTAVMTARSGTYRLVVSPILAPTEIGWVVFSVPLDAAEMRALEKLSAIPFTATMLARNAQGHWAATNGTIPPDAKLDSFVAAAAHGRVDSAETLGLPGGTAFVMAKTLKGADGKPSAALLLSYPLAQALAPFRALQIGIGLAGLLGLALVLWGSRGLARTIARPIAALDAAARALEEGARTEVTVTGADEIGRLAESFNKMSAGIVEREHRISHLAFHDTLTDLPNRAFFREQLDGALARAASRSDGEVVVLCLDLDGFKGVNDTLGHPIGDALLRIVGHELERLAPDATVSRLGGPPTKVSPSGAGIHCGISSLTP